MGHKVNPVGLRIGITNTWRSKWFNDKKEYSKNLKQDINLREDIMKKWKSSAIVDVEIERSSSLVRIIVRTARPGVLIGRGGSGIEEMHRYVKERFFKLRKQEVKIEVQEVKNFEEHAGLVAQSVAEQLEKRVPFRRVMKSMLEQILKNNVVKGVKIEMSGRLNGSEMARREWVAKGRLPLHTLRANIDFSRVTAYTTYGTIGVKVWLYKGEVFE